MNNIIIQGKKIILIGKYKRIVTINFDIDTIKNNKSEISYNL